MIHDILFLNIQNLTCEELETGYWKAYELFYRWGSIFNSAKGKPFNKWWKHVLYTAGWKKYEPIWDLAIKFKQLAYSMFLLEHVLD